MRLRVLLFEEPEDPSYNLAFEEALPRAVGCGVSPPTLRIWRNKSAVIIGYFQRAEEEVNLDEAKRRGVEVVRRFTGGGAAYHDMGNINYALSVPASWAGPESPIDYIFGKLIRGPVEALRSLGFEASLENVNDIVVSSRKVSGTAATVSWGSAFLHGAMLINADLSALAAVLKVSPRKLIDKGVSSVKYRVTNLSTIREVSMAQLVEALSSSFAKVLGLEGYYFDMPSPLELEIADALYEKYSDRRWNMERAPHSDFPVVEARVREFCHR